MQRSFRVNAGNIVFENYESESLAINLETGTYYSLTGPASRLWNMLSRGTPEAGIAEWFAAAYEGDREQIAESVSRFLARLEAEQLIVASDGTHPQPGAQESPPPQRVPFEGFELSVFTDMQDLLLLDPIHDSDETGWPATRA